MQKYLIHIACAALIMESCIGCAPVIVGATAGSAGVLTTQERTLGQTVDDSVIYTKIIEQFVQTDVNKLLTNINVKVHQGRVLLTGHVESANTITEAVRLTWKVRGVREVLDELKVNHPSDVKAYAQDTWITTEIKSRLLFEKNVHSNNYNIVTVDGYVYLIGLAKDKVEIDKVVSLAMQVKNVKEVVNYVTLISELEQTRPSVRHRGHATPAA